MNLQTQIQQQQSTVQMLEKLFKAKRCSEADLDQARRRLTDLQQQQGFKPIIPRPAKAEPVAIYQEPVATLPTGRRIDGDEYVSLQADLAAQADQLNRKMADLSNKLHQIPPTVDCPDLTRQILAIKADIETIWDKKRYLERNHSLPEEEKPDLPILDDKGKFELAYEKRKLIDQRSKLRGKLNNPKAKAGKLVEWETELAQCNLKIQEIEFKLS